MRKIIIIISFLLIVLEGILRIHYGMPPYEIDAPNFKYNYVDIYEKFFKKTCKENKEIFVNQRGKSKFSTFPVIKSPNTTRIFIIGGSVAGDWGDVTQFKKMLPDIIPGRSFEVINCGMDGYDSYREYLVEKEILSYLPDLIMVLSGNNEGNYNPVKVNVTAYYVNKLLRKLCTYRILQDKFKKWREKQHLLYYRDNKKILMDYENNLRHMVREAKKKRVSIILCTLPFNLRDCPPNGMSPINKEFLLAFFYLENSQYLNAINEFNNFLKDNPNDKFGFYFLGRAYDKIKDYIKAKEYYFKALELDYFNGRVSPKSNEIVRQVCIEERAGLADLEKAFTDLAPYGLIGRDQCRDNCHWWKDRYSLVAETVIREILQNNSKYPHILDGTMCKLDINTFNYQLSSLEELGKIDGNAELNIGKIIWELTFSDADLVLERSISYLETSYFMDQNSLNNVHFSKEKIKTRILNDYSFREFFSRPT